MTDFVSNNIFPKVILSEAAAPATPAAGQVKVYAKTDGLVYSKDDAGAETLMSSGASAGVTFVGCKVYNNATQSMPGPASTVTLITFNTAEYDTSTIHSAGVFTVPAGKGGKWRISDWIFTASGTASVVLLCRRNGTATNEKPGPRYTRNGSNSSTFYGEWTLSLAAGDTVRLYFSNGDSSAVSTGHASVVDAQNMAVMEYLGA